MLVASLALSAAVLKSNNSVSPEENDQNQKYWYLGFTGYLIPFWTMLVTFIAIIIELICVPLHIIIIVTMSVTMNILEIQAVMSWGSFMVTS